MRPTILRLMSLSTCLVALLLGLIHTHAASAAGEAAPATVVPQHDTYGYLHLRGYESERALKAVLWPLFEDVQKLHQNGTVLRLRYREEAGTGLRGLLGRSTLGADVIFSGPAEKVLAFVKRTEANENVECGIIGEVELKFTRWDGKLELQRFANIALALEHAQTLPLRRASHFKGNNNWIEYQGYPPGAGTGAVPFYVYQGW